MNKKIAIVGIHTDIGKTVVSAVLAEALSADYWKPIQAGGLDNSDSIIVSSLIANGQQRVHPEAFRLTEPLSPHQAARIDKITIDHTKLTFPETDNTLLVETAGGIMSPMSEEATMADFVQHHQLPAILVSRNYLGSISHTLSAIEVLKGRNIPVYGLIISGEPNESSEEYIERYGQLPIIARVPFLNELTPEAVSECAADIRESLLKSIK